MTTGKLDPDRPRRAANRGDRAEVPSRRSVAAIFRHAVAGEIHRRRRHHAATGPSTAAGGVADLDHGIHADEATERPGRVDRKVERTTTYAERTGGVAALVDGGSPRTSAAESVNTTLSMA